MRLEAIYDKLGSCVVQKPCEATDGKYVVSVRRGLRDILVRGTGDTEKAAALNALNSLTGRGYGNRANR